MTSKQKFTGAQAIIKSLIEEGTDIAFGYPGGQIMPVYDAIYEFEAKGEIRHIRSRHEQGAVHAAQGYARSSGRVGVCIATSGPGATNLITGIADAMLDSTPIVCITGQVGVGLLGTDAFQEVDITGVSLPITKWNYQITKAQEIPSIMAKAFYIARSGRPGPVLIDIAKNAQVETIENFEYHQVNSVRSYTDKPTLKEEEIKEAARLINEAKKPLLIFGQGITLSGAEQSLRAFVDKTHMPCAATLLGLSAIEVSHPDYIGMVGMHGNYAANILTNECDLLIAVGMRFDDRVTGNTNTYAKQAKILHIEIDSAEIGKIIPVTASVNADAKEALDALLPLLRVSNHFEWMKEFTRLRAIENEKIIHRECAPEKGPLKMAEVITKLAKFTAGNIVTVTDVGQHQMKAARYSTYADTRSMITSGGLGTMGFGLPAAFGAKLATPEREVVLIVGDGGMQMNIQELGTIMEYNIPVKVLILNNEYLGNVRQWQEMFFGRRYSATPMKNPDFVKLSQAYGIEGEKITSREELEGAFARMFADKNRAFVLECAVKCCENVFPMICPGDGVSDVILGDDLPECTCLNPCNALIQK